jgi:hypothetical protein
MIQRKCRNCSEWNGDSDYCSKCNYPLSPPALEAKKKAETPPPEVEDLHDYMLEKANNTRFWLIKLFYYSAYGITMLFIGIGALMAWLTAFFAA